MSRWRDTGFVQDSDEDDELEVDAFSEIINSRPFSTPQQPQPSSLYAETQIHSSANAGTKGLEPTVDLQEAICSPLTAIVVDGDVPHNYGASDIQDHAQEKITRQPKGTLPPITDEFSSSSSSLTSLSLSDSESDHASEYITGPPSTISHRPLDGVQVVITRAPPETRASENNSRKFRKRNPIQMHPYLLEGERYRQLLKAKGVRPVRIAADDHGRMSSVRELDSQEQNYQPAPRPLSSSPPHLPVDSPFYTRSTGRPREARLLSALGNVHRRYESIQSGSKRRKINHASASKLGHPSAYSNVESRSQYRHNDSSTDTEDMFDIPPSPPYSGSSPMRSTGSSVLKTLERTNDNDHAHLPTPLTSSANRPTAAITYVNPSPDDSPPLTGATHRRTTHLKHPLADDYSSESDSVSELSNINPGYNSLDQLRRVGKKIKGVLPASWLRLDLQAQSKGRRCLNVSNIGRGSQTTREPQRGVAQKVFKRRRRSPSRSPMLHHSDDVVVISDESDESTLSTGRNEPNLPPSTQGNPLDAIRDFVHVRADESLDDMEDDEVDFMEPAGIVRMSRGNRTTKRQQKLTDSFIPQWKRLKISQNGPSGKASSKVSLTRSRRNGGFYRIEDSSKLKSSPALSILDAEMMDSNFADKKVPDFIRIAARQARRGPDRGRHSPSNKCIRLQTSADTEDANRTLHQWRIGAIRPSSAIEERSYRTRQPLSDYTANQQQRLPDAVRKITQDRIKTCDAKHKPRNRIFRQVQLLPSKSSNIRDSNLATSIELQSPVTHPEPKRRLSVKDLSLRTAQLEGLEDEYNLHHPKPAFKQALQRAERQFLQQPRSDPRNFQLARFLDDEDAYSQPPEQKSYTLKNNHPRHLFRKRAPQRVDINVREYRQPTDPPPEKYLQDNVTASHIIADGTILMGLGPFGTQYTRDFDCFPLEIGTFFHASTFIGSGEFAACLRGESRNLDISSGHTLIRLQEINIDRGSWTEEVAAKLESAMQTVWHPIAQHLMPNNEPEHYALFLNALAKTSAFLRSLIAYFSTSLNFLDPIDRSRFVMKVNLWLKTCFENITITTMESSLDKAMRSEILQQQCRSLTYLLVLAAQLSQIARHNIVEATIRIDSESLLKKVSKIMIKKILLRGTAELRVLLEDSRRSQVRERGIRSDKVYVEATVVSMHVLDMCNISNLKFWDIVSDELSKEIHDSVRLSKFEQAWYNAFTLLPLTDFDSDGILQPGRRFSATRENWGFVRRILHRLFALYSNTSKARKSSLNEYMRVTMTRCHNLMGIWGWKRCETTLGVVFDYFAQNGLRHLRHEEGKGSSRFLEHLAENPSLEIQPGERMFHIFLKCLALGLQGMNGLYTEKKIRSITWRFIPNHGRTYRKEEDVEHQDLEALRNHHDILCTLYWASPAASRPPLKVLQQLVQHEHSHQEACRISVRAWAILSRFQMSIDEPYASMELFALWHSDIIKQTIQQYRLARTEAEDQFHTAQSTEIEGISSELLGSTIRKNQTQILATLRDAIAGMKTTISFGKDQTMMTQLLKESGTMDALNFFSAKDARRNSTVTLGLSLLQHYISLRKQLAARAESQEDSEESQDYGDFPDFEDVEDRQPNKTDSRALDFIRVPLWHLLSNAFGAEPAPDDILLMESINTWTALAQNEVQREERSWSDYMDAFSPTSWSQLRDTEQTRRFMAYFISRVIECDSVAYSENRNEFIAVWLTSLAERESVFKFQHRLTNVLLNTDAEHPLLKNLPFLRDLKTNRVDISISTLRERRLSLLSTVMANMRDSLESIVVECPSKAQESQRAYAAILRKLMAAMKSNYQELQRGASGIGAYEDFVQRVIHLLQLYTSDICAIDNFFTDSVAFPLPTTDPTYVVSRLGNYALKLAKPGSMKQLAAYIHTVLERAALDNEQDYLVNQFVNAVCDSYEEGDNSKPTLRRVLLEGIYPAYIEAAFDSTTGSIIALPLLQSLGPIFRGLMYQFSVTDMDSARSTTTMALTVLHGFRTAMARVTDYKTSMRRPRLVHVLALMFGATAAILPVLEYIRCRTRQLHDEPIESLVNYFEQLGFFVTEVTHSLQATTLPDYNGCDASHKTFPDLCDFSTEAIKAARNKWIENEGECSIVRGLVKKELVTNIGSLEEERDGMISAIEQLNGVLGRLSNLRARPDVSKDLAETKPDWLVVL